MLKIDCPVPFDQQPINEYLALKRTWLFNYATYDNKKYVFIISSAFFIFFIFIGFFSIYFFPHYSNKYKLLLLDLCYVNIFFFFLFARVYLGWSYILKRLLSASIFYEESGWYDGQIWIKHTHSMTKDRLIGRYHIMPIVNRIKFSFFIVSCNFILDYILYYLL